MHLHFWKDSANKSVSVSKVSRTQYTVSKLISINGLSFSYGAQSALQDVSLDLRSGSISALIGHNGAGKTTLMRAMVGLLPIEPGMVTVAGFDAAENPRSVHKIAGFLPDMAGFYPTLTVRQNLRYAAKVNGLEGEAERIATNETIRRLDLTKKEAEPAGNLSRGWRQRVSIAQAIIHSPRFLALDEPATGLDPEARNALSKLLLELNKDGMTLLVSSHILAELEDYCTQIVMLEDGLLLGQHDLQKTGSAQRKPNGEPLEIVLVNELSSMERALLILSQDEKCHDVRRHDNSITLEFSGNNEEQHTLLKNLFAADVKVLSAGSPAKQSVETLRDAYRRMTHATAS